MKKNVSSLPNVSKHSKHGNNGLVNSIMNEILSIPPLEFMGVERIIVLTQKWIWMAAEIARRQGRINTRWHQIQLELVEEDALGNHKFI